MFRRTALFVALLVLSLPALTTAGHGEGEAYGRCDSRGQPALGILEVTDGTPQRTFYVEDRNAVLGNGAWLWAETNGVWTPKPAGVYGGEVVPHDLQRGGSSDVLPDDAGTCTDVGDWIPDEPLPGRILP